MKTCKDYKNKPNKTWDEAISLNYWNASKMAMLETCIDIVWSHYKHGPEAIETEIREATIKDLKS